jgi:hypothetical protein
MIDISRDKEDVITVRIYGDIISNFNPNNTLSPVWGCIFDVCPEAKKMKCNFCKIENKFIFTKHVEQINLKH